jgi:hypothetical protein
MHLRPVLLALPVLIIACTPGGGFLEEEQNEASATIDAGPAATVSVAGRSNGDCSISWNGQAVTAQQLQERGFQLNDSAVQEIGIANMTEENTPYLRLEAPSDVPWVCLRPAVAGIREGVFFHVQLKLADDPDAPFARAEFAFGDRANEPMGAIGIDGAGSLTWIGETITPESLTIVAQMAPSPGTGSDVTLAPSDDAPFRAIHDTARHMEREGRTIVFACFPPDGGSGEPSASPPCT